MSKVTVYKWWNGVSRETYYDEDRPNVYRVPYAAVRYHPDPSHYRRVVLERDSRFNEPVTVAYEPSDSSRRRMVVSNKRFGFHLHTLADGTMVLQPTVNSKKLLRNAVMWCTGLGSDRLDKFQPQPFDPDSLYDSGTQAELLFNGMDLPPVCGDTSYLERVLNALPESGLVVPAKYLPDFVTSDLTFENTEVPVYCRSVEGSEQLRVEFGEYKRPASIGGQDAYTTPNYSEVPPTITVSGAGSDEMNGAYEYTGEANGKAYWQKDETYYLYSGTTARWYIETADHVIKYEVVSDADLPHKTGWVVYDYYSTGGDLPSPTLSYDKVSETGVVAGGSVYKFWDGLWQQSAITGSYMADLLDTRVGGSGVPREEDIAKRINPARLVLAHFLSRGAAVVLVDVPVPTDATDDEVEAALREKMAATDDLPWSQINKTLPTSANCVTIFVVNQR